ncbi:sigma-54-dependent transcriptional regulator [Thioalkalivibrio sulfidiphilus]|uniref:sigma-54-dependent transcriptional regulator n=1 Tax=Thioalkalivibrio sulfidiphilus TaxID=1033854 RepID=UPI0003726BA0|nr:sigma-54 dependent transcriptional regulator [Thioalkalivibrio sulfidiphilus]
MTEAKARILVVEDDTGHRGLLRDELTDAGHQVTAVADAEAALAQLDADSFDLVLSDLRLPGASGLELLARCRRMAAAPGFIIITAFGTIPQAVQALREGADDFLTKPVDLEHLVLAVGRVLRHRALQAEVSRYRALLNGGDFHGLIGSSPPMLELFEAIRRIARAPGPVLITGESGTGKELVARAVHAESERAEGPFVAINCAGIPMELLESELFGHVAGAFSGATGARKGLFAEAHGGSLLLDEIGEMPVTMQAKLLRLLQDGRVRPVGSNREQPADVRILAATHRDLASLIRDGDFREDLFYRLETFHLAVPPLRARGEDVERLALAFLRRAAAAQGRAIRGITPEALRALRRYPYPGNVRELASILERAVTFCRGEEITEADLPERVLEDAARSAGSEALWGDAESLPTLAQVEERYIRHVLERVGGNKRQAARLLGIGRRTLYRRLGEG